MPKLKGRKQRRKVAAIVARGREFLRSGPDEEALAFTESAIQQFPDDPEVRLIHATILLGVQPERVGAEAAKAAELGPDNPAILVQAGHLLLSRGDEEAARSCVNRANELVKPDFALMGSLDNLTGVLAAFAGETDVAERKLRAAVDREPTSGPIAKDLAFFLEALGRQGEGVEVLDEALKHVEWKEGGLEEMRDRLAAEAAES
jgi:Flp pilus assembly protein TadD